MDGDIDLAHWPEQIYRIKSKIDFQTQKSIFFHTYNFSATGLGDFTGTFHLFKGGRELKGAFSTPMARVKIGAQNWSFPNLRGNVLWLPEKLGVTDATSGLYGGSARFDYRLAPLNGKNAKPAFRKSFAQQVTAGRPSVTLSTWPRSWASAVTT